MNAGKYCMMSNPTVWISILVKPPRSTTTCKCCTLFQMHVHQFSPCVTFHVFRNSQTSLFCLQAQSHWTVQQYWMRFTEPPLYQLRITTDNANEYTKKKCCSWHWMLLSSEINKPSDNSTDIPLLDWKECLSVSFNPFLLGPSSAETKRRSPWVP